MLAASLATGLLLAAFAATGAGCAGGDDPVRDGDAKPELVVFAASSLGPAFERYGDELPDASEVRYSFAGSDELAAQIRQGVTPDVYAAASTELPDELAAEGLLDRPRAFATNRLVVGVPAGSGIDDVADLEAGGVTVAIGDEDVPVGGYTREVLAKLEPEASAAILANVASSEPDVAGIVGKLTQGAVDAGFVYRSDVVASAGELEAIELPKRVSPEVSYGIAVATDAGAPKLAARFIDGLRDGAGRTILGESGFGPPPPR